MMNSIYRINSKLPLPAIYAEIEKYFGNKYLYEPTPLALFIRNYSNNPLYTISVSENQVIININDFLGSDDNSDFVKKIENLLTK